MSLTTALSSATSGLAAASRSAELVSSNVANALTDGYGRREIQLSSLVVGGQGAGVRVNGTERVVDQVAMAQRRLADASAGNATTTADFFRNTETVLGVPTDPGSFSARIVGLETALEAASSVPESNTHLAAVAYAARDLANFVNTASDAVQQARTDADAKIGAQVSLLNSSLKTAADLNDQIRRAITSGSDPSGLMDQRQRVIDTVSSLIPITEITREHSRATLVAENGTILVGDKAAEFLFDTTALITPDMDVNSGRLSGLSIIGAESSAGTPMEAIPGGSIAAEFEIRDNLAVNLQAQLDSFARVLIERTSDPAVDPTLGGGVGMFTDAGTGFSPTAEIGLASRIEINAQIDPKHHSDFWQVRDGLGAATQGPTGNSSIIRALSDAFSGQGAGSATPGIAELGSSISSLVGTSRSRAEAQEAFSMAQVVTFKTQEGLAGVDTDQEMQKLLVIEQSYAANAKIIETIDQMIQSLLRI